MFTEMGKNAAASLSVELTTNGGINMEVDIIVECNITGNKAEYEYDIDNTLMSFMWDVNAESPPLGFSPSDATEDSAVFIDGTTYWFIDDSGKTLAELGAKDGSLIVICGYICWTGPSGDVNFDEKTSTYYFIDEEGNRVECDEYGVPINSPKTPTPTVVPKPPKKKVRSKLKKITRPSLKKKPPRVIKKIDPYNMNHLELMKTAALNEIAIGTTVNSMQQLKSHLNQLIQTGKKIRLSLPKKWRKKTFVTPIGEIKYSNILLWCDGTDDLDLSTIHLQTACNELFVDTVENPDIVGEKVFRLINTRCSEPGCNGTFRLWNLKDNPPKFI